MIWFLILVGCFAGTVLLCALLEYLKYQKRQTTTDMTIVLRFFEGVRGWIVNIGAIIFAPITIDKQIVIVMARTIEDWDPERDPELKRAIQAAALDAGCADRLHKIIKTQVEEIEK